MPSEQEAIDKAWKDWAESEEGKRCGNRATLMNDPGLTRYLENRLWLAFMAGKRAANAICSDACAREFQKRLEAADVPDSPREDHRC